MSLLAVGHAGTRLRRLPADRLRELARDPGTAADLAARLDGWLAGLLGGISRAAGPKVFAELRPGAETHLAEAGKAARPREGVAWVRHLEGSSRLLGEAELALRDGRPLPRAGGALAGERRRGADRPPSARATSWPDEELWPGLARFHELCLALRRPPEREGGAAGPRAPRAPAGPRPLQPAGRLRPARLRSSCRRMARAPVSTPTPTRSSPPAPWSARSRGSPSAPAPTRRPAASWRTASPRSAPPRGSAPAG